jgi:hypothetical protein
MIISRVKLRKLPAHVGRRRVTFGFADGDYECIGFTDRELGRRDVGQVLKGQKALQLCTGGPAPFWVHRRRWFPVKITRRKRAAAA